MSGIQQESVESPYHLELRALRGNWGWFLLLGIILVIVGMMALSRQYITALAGVTVFTVMLLVAGGVEIVSSIWAGRWRGFFIHLLTGLVYLAVGLMLLEQPVRAVAGLTLIMGVAFIVKGVMAIIVSLSHRFHSWGWVLLDGVISLALGIMIWERWPDDSFFFLSLFIGIEILFAGWSWIMLALAASSIPATPAPPAV